MTYLNIWGNFQILGCATTSGCSRMGAHEPKTNKWQQLVAKLN